MDFKFKNVYYVLICAIALCVCIYFGRPLLAPLSTALLSSFILLPICIKLEGWGFSRIMASFTAIALSVIILVGLTYLFSSQIASLAKDFSDFETKLTDLMNRTISFAKNSFNMTNLEREDLLDDTQKWVEKTGPGILTTTVSQTTTMISGLLMIIVYTFLLLIYRSGFKNVIVGLAKEKDRHKTHAMLRSMQMVGKKYVIGMSLMIGILGLANSAILLIFGIEHAFFFGYLAAFLSIIPYVGTTIGAIIPILYAFVTTDSYLIPLGIMISFWFVQLIESNFLNPKIVGGNLNINAFAAILSLIIGGYMWGIIGMALFLPLTAIFRVFCGHFHQLKPVEIMLSNDLYEHRMRTNFSPLKESINRIVKKKLDH